MDLKLLIKRGALLAAANWQVVVIQFVAETTFQALLAVPLVGAALLVALLLGADVAHLLQGSVQDIFRGIADALTAEPLALAGFVVAFAIVFVGGCVLTFLVKGGTVDILLESATITGQIEHGAVTLSGLREAARFSVARFVGGCRRLFRRYLALGFLLMLAYALSGAAFLAFVVFGYRAAEGRTLLLGWTFVAAGAALLLTLWITFVNLVYLLFQIAIAAEDVGLVDAGRKVAGLMRTAPREVGGVFLVMLVVVIAATFASALAWSGVGLIAFVPLIGLAVMPLQLAALLLRGLVFEYLGLTSLGAYMSLYRQHAGAVRHVAVARASASHPAS